MRKQKIANVIFEQNKKSKNGEYLKLVHNLTIMIIYLLLAFPCFQIFFCILNILNKVYNKSI